jgi:hypothetical protein
LLIPATEIPDDLFPARRFDIERLNEAVSKLFLLGHRQTPPASAAGL